MNATPRALVSAEIFDGWELKAALEHEVGTVASMLGYSTETLAVSQHQADVMPRATWSLPGWAALQALVALLSQDVGVDERQMIFCSPAAAARIDARAAAAARADVSGGDAAEPVFPNVPYEEGKAAARARRG